MLPWGRPGSCSGSGRFSQGTWHSAGGTQTFPQYQVSDRPNQSRRSKKRKGKRMRSNRTLEIFSTRYETQFSITWLRRVCIRTQFSISESQLRNHCLAKFGRREKYYVFLPTLSITTPRPHFRVCCWEVTDRHHCVCCLFTLTLPSLRII